MWSTIANLKENLNKIAQDVHDDEDDEELEIYGANGGVLSPLSNRRNSHSFAHSNSVSRSPLANGIDSPTNPEIDQYKAEIKRLQESESEIKALSINYASLLKEKEDQISRLNKENGSLKHNLERTSAALNVSKNEIHKLSTNGTNALKGTGEHSPSRQHKLTTQAKSRYSGNPIHNGVVSKQDGMNNGITRAVQSDLRGKEREFADLLEENNSSSAAVQATAEMRQLQMELDRERDHRSNIQLKLEEEKKLNESFREELKSLKMEKDKTSTEMSKIHDELNEKISAVKRLQMELNRREDEGADAIVENLKRSIATLEKENARLKMEKNELKATMEMSRISTEKTLLVAAETPTKHASNLNEKVGSSASFPGKEKMELSLQKLDREIKETRHERDKAIQELTRLKQHLLDKETEESEKMDEDSKIIEELRETNEHQKAHIQYLEKALKQAIANHEEVNVVSNKEIQKSKELIDDLNKKLANCMSTIDAKNIELLNLQTALGQYYAEIEAKTADNQAELSKREKDEILSKLLQAERTLTDWKGRVNKLEEDNAKLRRALEQSMTRLNRMSVDSDFLVDRRIVIKLLVTYFQRNHSKEVLDLMVRMLGFNDEDKQRIGGAQQGAGKGVVRGVLGLPGRLVGGILGGSSGQVPANAATDNQSFADLWVDFLLKESEERERREAMDAVSVQDKEEFHKSPNIANVSPSKPDPRTTAIATAPGFSRTNFSPSQNTGPFPFRGNVGNSEHSDSEFSTVPLSSSDSNFQSSKLLQKY
ncbi:Golgin candidate [Parasponia andersonii]|uniref:Golgin candidate n=1 Tax=Parasponia andersonii TaxID=3476 RepID=A0A2P5A833_PARAD|nr:Golgin candidate [Parasponia andersonii]